MITIDATMLIQIFNILILIVIMNAVLFRPVRSILEQRAKKLDEMEKDILTFNRNARLRLEEFDGKLNDARRKAKDAVDTVRGEAQAGANEKISAMRQESDAAKVEQVSQIRAEFSKAQQELTSQVEGFASAMAAKVLGRVL